MSDEPPKDVARTDQDFAQIRNVIPRLWKALYDGCVEQDFSEEQALRLVIAYIRKPGT